MKNTSNISGVERKNKHESGKVKTKGEKKSEKENF